MSRREVIELTFPLKKYETTEQAAGVEYRVQWKGSSVPSRAPAGNRVPLYAHRSQLNQPTTEFFSLVIPGNN